MNGIELFERIKQVSTFDELLQSVTGKTATELQSKRGNLFEKTCDLAIKFGFCPFLSNDIHEHYEGNVNTCKLRVVDNLETYLSQQSVFSKGKGGTSDITLQNRITNKWVFISSKFYLDDSKKSIGDYDVEKLMAIIKQHSHKYKECDIYLLVNNKEKVLNTISSCQSTNNYIAENIHHVLDLSDFEPYFQNLKHAIQDISINEVNARFCNAKVPLEPRFHQDLLTYSQMKKIVAGEKELLLGAKARSGKTYCVGGLFIKYYKHAGRLNALIITPAPTETLSQFTDDLFRKFRDFIDINIVEIKKGCDFECMNLQGNNIIIVSKQLLDDYVFEKKVESIQHLNLDFIVFDENHFHGTTQMSKDMLQAYSCQNTVKVYLTATYAKPLNEWSIPADCQFYWDIEDEQLCKQRNVLGLIEKHGEDVLLFLTEENKESKLSVYDRMPDLHILTNMMNGQKYAAIKERIKDTSYGFSNSTLLCGNFPAEVDMILRYITGSNKEEDYPEKDLSIFGRIKRKCISADSRTKLNNGDFTTQLWFLPFGINMSISKVSEHLKDRMLKNSTLKRYEIKIVNSKKDYKVKDLKDEIKNWELKAKDEGKDGLILLAGNQLTLGITLPFVDIVFLFNDIVSSDKIIQMMYRCMTESMRNAENDKINNGHKKMGFVVDLNISRVLNTLLDYNVHKKDLSVEQKITYLVERNLINIDSDLFESKENKTKLVEKLLDIWKSDPINNLKILLKKIEECVIVDLLTTDQKALNRHFTSSVGDKKVNVKIQFDEESVESLPDGLSIIKDVDSTGGGEGGGEGCGEEGGGEGEGDIDKDLNISLTKDVLPFILPLICILTMNTQNNDILEMFDIIIKNPSLLYVFEDQVFVWWNNKDIIKLIKHMVEKYIKRESSIYNIAIQFKLSLQNLIDKPKELLELIDSCLKPKQKEKQEHGEVFTPMVVVFELLDKLDSHYFAEHGRSIFSEKNFKWFDPASGMGNFPVAVYLRLMEGLAEQIPDVEERKKHIIENMLYMSELNKKNVFICHQIFNVNNQYRMNLYEGDTLELNVESEWSIAPNSFDVVLGNPPYNKGNIRAAQKDQSGMKSETIWNRFVDNTFKLWLKPDGYLVFINPLSWLKKSHALHNTFLEKRIIWLKLWDYIRSLSKINGKIPISLYVLQNSPNNNRKTEIVSEIQSRRFYTTSSEYLNPKYSIPLAFHSIFNKLANFIESQNLQLEYKTKTVKSTGVKTKIPAEYTLDDMLAVDTFTIKDGVLVKPVTEHHPDANKRKLIISNKASFTGAFIDEGRLSLTGNHKFYILGENLELIEKMLRFKIMDIISHCCKYAQEYLENDAFHYIPDIRKLGLMDIGEDEFYTLIGLTPREIVQIKTPALAETMVDESVEPIHETVVAPITPSILPSHSPPPPPSAVESIQLTITAMPATTSPKKTKPKRKLVIVDNV